MIKVQNDLKFPPVIKGKISDIYPWIEMGQDHLDLIKFLLGFREYNQSILESYFGTKSFYLLDSGKSAIYLCLKAIGVVAGDEVLIAAFNCPAILEAIVKTGATPCFVDINDELGLEIASLKKAVNSRTRAVIATNLFGLVDDLESISKFCDENRLIFINDLAQTVETVGVSKKLNDFGDASIYSFGPEKQIFALGGGALVCRNNALNAQIALISPKETVLFNEVLGVYFKRWKYYFTFFVLKYLRTSYSFFRTLGLVNNFSVNKYLFFEIETVQPRIMHSLQQKVLSRNLLNLKDQLFFNSINFEYLKKNINIKIFGSKFDNLLYATMMLEAGSRFDLSECLAKNGVQTVWNYIPLYYGKGFEGAKKLYNTEKIWTKVLSIPFRYPLKHKRVEEITGIINSYFKNGNFTN